MDSRRRYPRDSWLWLTEGRGRLVLVAFVFLFAALYLGQQWASFQLNGWGWDYDIYMARARDFVEGRGFYLPRQLGGPYVVQNGDALYPPPVVLLMVPFLWLPPIAWWAIPLGITGAVLVWHRPALWAWVVITVIAAFHHYLVHEVNKGNPGMWSLALLSLATIRPFFAPFVALKWGLAPFALFGVWTREWWAGAGVLAAISVALAPLWFDYVRVVLDARGNTIEYMLFEWPMLCIPLVAWLARTRGRASPSGSPGSP